MNPLEAGGCIPDFGEAASQAHRGSGPPRRSGGMII